jgi:sugar/nucleoside kinase (ribokinase family)
MLLVVGTIGLDRIETPHETREECLGGSAIHFAYAASIFGPLRVVGVVGEDFTQDALHTLAARNIDTAGIEIARGATFRWGGRYLDDMDHRETLYTELGVFDGWNPTIPPAWADSRTIFLANASPQLQLSVLGQVPHAELVVCDTMNLWIKTERDALEHLLRRVHGAIVNDSEAVMFTGEHSTIRAGAKLLDLGPSFVIVKKGTHGALLFTLEGVCALPAYPLASVCDPTGAGDSFAGGFLGYLTTQPSRDQATLKRAVAYATCVASFNVEDFGTDRLCRLEHAELEERLNAYRMMVSID